LVSTLQAIYRQSAGQLIKAFFVQLPLALLLGVVAIQIVILCLSATDALCTEVAGGTGSDVKALLGGMTKGLATSVGDPSMATFVLLLVGLLVAAPPSSCGSSSSCGPPRSMWLSSSCPSHWPRWCGRRCPIGAAAWWRH